MHKKGASGVLVRAMAMRCDAMRRGMMPVNSTIGGKIRQVSHGENFLLTRDWLFALGLQPAASKQVNRSPA